MALDIKVGDTVRFSYKRFNAHIVSSGDVVEDLGNDTYLVKVSSGVEAEVHLRNILERRARVEERKIPVHSNLVTDPDDLLNTGVSGVRFKHRRDRHGNHKDKG